MRVGVMVLLPLLLAAGPVAGAKPLPAAPAVAEARADAGLVFALTTGLDDVGTMTSAFRHAQVVQESGAVDSVTVIVYGRAIVVFDPAVTAVPAEVRTVMASARASGVRIVACETALEKYGITKETAASQAETVPQGIVEVARLAGLGHEVLTY